MRARSGLWSALQDSVLELELFLARADQALSTLAIVVCAGFYTVEPNVAVPLGVMCVFILGCSTLAHHLLKEGIALPQVRIGLPLMEISVPALAFWLMVEFEGPGYALGSWVPPQLFCLYVAANILRLNVAIPSIVGIVAAIEFFSLYWFVAKPGVEGDGILLHQTNVQVVRTLSLVLTGFTCSFAVGFLRNIIQKTSSELRSRELFGKYRLVREVASGGMGVVHEALYCPEGGFERRVAIKVVHPHLAADPGFIERFRDEAELCALMAHPNIVTALDFGLVDNTYFFAMEFVDGPTLREILDRQRRANMALDPGLVALIGIEVAEGLHYAHRVVRGADGRTLTVLHRDLSPANILIDTSGMVKILDFGVARALRDSRQLHTTNLVGKPSYLAPEQLEDHLVDERSDLWSVAVVLWELLVNNRLFRRTEEASTLRAVVDDSVPAPTSVRSEVAAEWDVFFRRALSREPDQRYPSAMAFRDALREIWEICGSPDAKALAALAWTDEEDVELLELDDDTGGLLEVDS